MLDKERYIHKNMGTTDERFEIKERHRTMKKKKRRRRTATTTTRRRIRRRRRITQKQTNGTHMHSIDAG